MSGSLVEGLHQFNVRTWLRRAGLSSPYYDYDGDDADAVDAMIKLWPAAAAMATLTRSFTPSLRTVIKTWGAQPSGLLLRMASAMRPPSSCACRA